MDSQSYKTISANKNTVVHDWYIIDATNLPVGRLASKVALMLKGKHKPSYTPHVDTGDNIIIINAEKVRFTGNKMADKVYLRFSGYAGGQSSLRAEEIMEKHPTRIIEMAVKGMLPKNTLGRAMFRKLFVYAGGEHKHIAQKPKQLTL